MQTFAAGSALHALALAVIVALAATAIVVRRRQGAGARSPSPVERTIGFGYLALALGTFTWLTFPPQHNPLATWPLQLCHWAAAIAALSLTSTRRLYRALAYFWGLALSTQALITPNLREGPALWPFWFFWATHAIAVAVPIYDVLARRFRPTWRDYGVACAAAAAYVAIVLPIDLATGWNYGFVGPSTPGVPSIVDFLGPWPLRLAWIALIAAGAMALLMLPWIGVAGASHAVTRTGAW